jgi:putative solute:sodium symporter small subunit
MMRFKPQPKGLSTHWDSTKRLTRKLLLAWFFTTFLTIFFARELSNVTLFGWSLSFYMAAQGAPLIYVMIVAVYAWRMRRLDKKFKNGN